MSKFTQKYLQQHLVEEEINKNMYYYSIIQKPRSVLSFINKNRLLIYSQKDNIITYVEEQRPPFGNEKYIPVFNKDKADLMASTVHKQPKSNIVEVNYPKKNEKNEKVFVRWQLIMKNQGLAQKWYDFLNEQKSKRLKDIKNPESVGNVVPAILMPKTEQKKEEVQVQDYFLRSSRLKQDPKKVEQQKRQSNNNTFLIDETKKSGYDSPKKQQSQVKKQTSPRKQDKQDNNDNKNIYQSDNHKLVYESNLRSKESDIRKSKIEDSKIKPKNESQLKNDWNYRFIKDPGLELLHSFEKTATQAFLRIADKDKDKTNTLRNYEVDGLSIFVADNFTNESKSLKKQFRNYHYIMQTCDGSPLIGVPMSSLIQYRGVVALVKAGFPSQSSSTSMNSIIQQLLKQLQIRTKVSSSILFNSNCTFYDMTNAYGSIGELPRIFIDDLEQYLPQLNNGNETFYVRPQLIQYHIGSIIPGGNLQEKRQNKAKNQINSIMDRQTKQLVSYLSGEDIYITNIFDLKQYLHEQGINLKLLPKLFTDTKNKFVKKYIQTCLVAKIAKDDIVRNMKTIKKTNQSLEKIVQNRIRFFIEGKSANNNEEWKKLAVEFRKRHGVSMNTHEIEGGFFLSCLITLINADYDINKIDKQKVIFQDNGIIQEGFVKKLNPKVKTFYRYSNRDIDKIAETCKFSEKNEKIYEDIVEELELKNRKVPKQFELNKGRLYILAYLSQFASPSNMGNNRLASSDQIYSYVNYEPPSSPTLKITLNYLMQCIQNNNTSQFEKCIQKAQQIINYWLGFEHPQICDVYGCLSDYEWRRGQTQQSIRIQQKILRISTETQGKNKKKIGTRLYALGGRQLESGHKKQAMETFKKSQKYLQQSNQRLIEYPILLMKMSSLYLNVGDIRQCIEYGNRSLIQSQGLEVRLNYIIKTYQILGRAYEINGDKQELRKLGLKCGKQFNNTEKTNIFGDMVKIGLTGTIAKLSKDKCEYLLKLVNKMHEDGELLQEEESLKRLMQMAKDMTVMEKFILRTQSVQKLWHDTTSGKKIGTESIDYLRILAFVTGYVELEFIIGLISQKDYE